MFGKFNIIHTGRRDIIKPFKKLHGYDFHRLCTKFTEAKFNTKVKKRYFPLK